jgi:hypothetical protein
MKRQPLKVVRVGTSSIPSSHSGIERACEGLYSELALRGHHITAPSL